MRGDKKKLWRFWSANWQNMVIVAVITEGIDWAAYIGGQPSGYSEQDTVNWTAKNGCKLSEKEARAFFDVGLPYRD